MRVVYRRKMRLIFAGVPGGEPVALVLGQPHPAGASVLGDEPAELGRGVARHLPKVLPQKPLLGSWS